MTSKRFGRASFARLYQSDRIGHWLTEGFYIASHNRLVPTENGQSINVCDPCWLGDNILNVESAWTRQLGEPMHISPAIPLRNSTLRTGK